MPMPVLAFCYLHILIFSFVCLLLCIKYSQQSKRFFSSPKLSISEAKPGSYSIGIGSLPLGIKWPVPEAVGSSPSSAEVEWVELSLYALCMLSCCWHRLHFYYTKLSAKLLYICEKWLARSCTTHRCQAFEKYFILPVLKNYFISKIQQLNNGFMTYISQFVNIKNC